MRTRLNRTNRRGSNQYTAKKYLGLRYETWLTIMWLLAIGLGAATACMWFDYKFGEKPLHSPIALDGFSVSVGKVIAAEELAAAPEPTPTELEEIVAYIARTFEPEGKDVVVRAINCFYSESGLRKDAVGQNTDGPRSKDHGVAQLNDHWHKLTAAQKTEIRANIDKAYQIYQGRGGNFDAWYGKGCR